MNNTNKELYEIFLNNLIAELGEDYEMAMGCGGAIYVSGGLWIFPDGELKENKYEESNN